MLIPIPELLSASMALCSLNQHMHLEDIAKEAGVLKDWEETGTAKAVSAVVPGSILNHAPVPVFVL